MEEIEKLARLKSRLLELRANLTDRYPNPQIREALDKIGVFIDHIKYRTLSDPARVERLILQWEKL